MRLTDLLQPHLVDDKLAHEVHERIEFFDVHADALALVLLFRRSRLCRLFLVCGCRLCRRCRCCGSCRSSGSSLLADLVGINRLYGDIFDLGNRIHGILHRLGVAGRGDKNIKAALKLLLLKIFSGRNTLDDIADLIERIHDHDRTCRLEDTGLHQGNLDMEQIHAGFFCLFHDIEINVIKIKARSFGGRGSGGSCCRSRGSSRCRRCRSSLGDGTELCDKIRNIDDIFRLAVADAVHHLFQ